MVTTDPLVELLVQAIGPTDHSYIAGTDGVCLCCGITGSYGHSAEAQGRAAANTIPEAKREALLLGLAWAEAEAALPDGWQLNQLVQVRSGGWMALAWNAIVTFEEAVTSGFQASPTAALQALTAKLRERQS